jgi:hypothetical protein
VLAASAPMLIWMGRHVFTNEIPYTGDLFELHYPLRHFYAQALTHGQRFDWMPSIFGGFSLSEDGQAGPYHPLHLALYRFLPIHTAFNIEFVLAYPFVFAGTWLLLRRWCGAAASAFGAMLFTLSGFNLSHGVHVNMVAVASHIPWLLWAIHGAFIAGDMRARARSAATIALLTGSQLLLGHPQVVWFSGLLEVAYIVLLATTASSRFRAIAAIVAGKLLGLAVGAVQFLGTLHAFEHSSRASAAQSFATSIPLEPRQILQLLNPYVFWRQVIAWSRVKDAGDEFAAYGGGVALVLASWWVASYLRNRRHGRTTASDRFGVWALVVAVVGVWLATGAYGRLYYLQTWLPLVGGFRVPARYILFTQFALAVLSALALMRLSSSAPAADRVDRRALWAPWCVAAASVVASAVLAWPFRAELPGSTESMMSVALVPVLFISAAALVTMAVRGARFAVVGLVLLAAGDQGLYGLVGVRAWHDFTTREGILEFLDLDDSLRGTSARLMVSKFSNMYVVGDYRVLNGYTSLMPAKLLDYRSPAAMRVAQVEYVHSELKVDAGISGVEPWRPKWYRVVDPLPRVRLVSRGQVSNQPALDIQRIDVEQVALVTHPVDLDDVATGTAEILTDDPGAMRVRTRSPGRQLLIVSESYDEGWIAAVDGQPAQVERVNGDFLGCVVGPGDHVVSLKFRPAHLVWGKSVSGAGFLVALVLMAIGSRPSRATR